MKIHFGAAFLLLCGTVAFGQQSATITASRDNSIFSESGSLSNGAGAYVFSGKTNSGNNRRSLIFFDLSETIPANVIITSAKVKMRVSKVPGDAVTASFALHKLTADWGEGTSDGGSNEGGGGAASANDATWTFSFFNTKSWSANGGDFSSTASSSVSISGLGSVEWASTAQLVSDVQSWVSNPSANFGWIIIGGETDNKSAKRFDSRSAPTASNRPQLVIAYTTPTSVGTHTTMPHEFTLEQNYPNPFNPATTIAFTLPEADRTILKIFDLLGNEVTTIVDRTLSAGTHTVSFDGSTLSSGIYFYRLQSGIHSSMKKLLLLK